MANTKGVERNIANDGGNGCSDVNAQAKHPDPSDVQSTSTTTAGTATNGAKRTSAGNGYMSGTLVPGMLATTVSYGFCPASHAFAPSNTNCRSDGMVG